MHGLSNPRYSGIFPVVTTTFHDDATLDLVSQKRCVDFMIDSGVDGVYILANFSEQFLIADDERELLTRLILDHVAGRVPVIVTTTQTAAPYFPATVIQPKFIALFGNCTSVTFLA